MLGRAHGVQLRLRGNEFRPGAPGQLAAGANRAAHGVRDGLEGHPEHVVQHEADPLPRAEPAQHLQQRGADLVVEGDPVGRVEPRRGRLLADIARTFVPRAGRAQLVQAEPAGHHGQPAPHVVDVARGGQPQECLLRNVFRVADVAQHLVGEVDQVGTVTTPGLGDLVVG
ncbi:hypothetical protein MOKP4_43630 [Mycobacterium avium subsp. hominissuis]